MVCGCADAPRRAPLRCEPAATINPRHVFGLSIAIAMLLLAVGGCARLEPESARVEWRRPTLPLEASAVVPPLPARLEESVEHWAGFRGGALQGVSSERVLPVQWESESGVRWRAPLEGRGGSSPVVWGDRVWVTTAVERSRSKLERAEPGGREPGGREPGGREPGGRELDRTEQRIQLLCLDRWDGRLLWQRDLGAARGRTHRKNGYASSTVATDGQRVVACCGEGGLHCFDVQGNWLWQVPLGKVGHQWGFASSPVLFGDLVIQLCDGEAESFLAAYSLADGELAWRVPRDSQGCWSTPVLVPLGEGSEAHWELVVNGTASRDGTAGLVIAYDPASGQELWRVRGTTDIPCPSAIVGDGLIISSSGGNGPLLAIRPGGRGDVTESHVAWRQSTGGPYVPTGVIYAGRLYVLSDGGKLSCQRLEDGAIVWQKRLRGTYSASLVAGGGCIYAVSEQGDTHVLAAGDSFQKLATNRLREPCLATPAIAGGELLLRTESHLVCIAGAEAVSGGVVMDPRGVSGTVGSPSDRQLPESWSLVDEVFSGQETGFAEVGQDLERPADSVGRAEATGNEGSAPLSVDQGAAR